MLEGSDQAPLLDEIKDEWVEGEQPRTWTAKPQKDPRRSQRYIQIVIGIACFCTLLIWLGRHTAWPRVASSGPVDWQPCEEDSDVLCGYLIVPTDYDDPSVGSTTLALTKIPALVPEHKRKGTVMVNYGGPGISYRKATFGWGKAKLSRYCPSYDLVTWDMRGMGRTTPSLNCHGSAFAADLALAGTVNEATFDVPPDPFSPAGTAHLVAQQREAEGIIKLQADLCRETVGAEVLKYMGTTTLIRDMEHVNALLEGEGSKINLISGSYGTIVAAYLTNMLPSKIGKVLTWGVAETPLWVNQHYEDYDLLRSLLADSEIAYDWFLDDCHTAANDSCLLARKSDASAEDIKRRIDAFLDHLYDEPMPVPHADRPGLLKSGMVRAVIFNLLQHSDLWPDLAQALDEAMRGNGTLLRNARVGASNPHPKPAADGFLEIGQVHLTDMAVSCADAPPYLPGEAWPKVEDSVHKLQAILREVTPRFGATVDMMEQHGGCQFWPRSDKPVERFTGPWNSSLSNVILVASNSHDPVTPRRSGKAMADLYGPSARHIVQEAPGHAYITEPVPGMLRATVDYFERDVVPEKAETVYPSVGRNYLEPLRV